MGSSVICFSFQLETVSSGSTRATSFLRFLDHTQRHTTTVDKTLLDEGSARRRDFYLATHNNHKRQESMPLAGFEPAIQASELPLSLWDQPVRTHYQAHKYLCIICAYVLVVCGKVDGIICSDWFLCVHWLFKARRVRIIYFWHHWLPWTIY
jgi:hypothetical protein